MREHRYRHRSGTGTPSGTDTPRSNIPSGTGIPGPVSLRYKHLPVSAPRYGTATPQAQPSPLCLGVAGHFLVAGPTCCRPRSPIGARCLRNKLGRSRGQDGTGMGTGAAKAPRQRPHRVSPSSPASLPPSGSALTADRGRRRAAAPRGALALLPPAAAAMLPPHVGAPGRQQGLGPAPDSAYWLWAGGSRLLLALRHRLPATEARPAPPSFGGRAVTRCDVTLLTRPRTVTTPPYFDHAPWRCPRPSGPGSGSPCCRDRPLLLATRSSGLLVRAPGPPALPPLPPMVLRAQSCSWQPPPPWWQ